MGVKDNLNKKDSHMCGSYLWSINAFCPINEKKKDLADIPGTEKSRVELVGTNE